MYDHFTERRRIRVPGATPEHDYFLAVPPIPAGTPRAVRIRILEYVLRRQYTFAAMLADDATETADRRAERLGVLMSEEPHHTPRNWSAA